MTNHPLLALAHLGQSIWFDNIERGMLQNGELARMIRDEGLKGITSNPTIFQKAITGSAIYSDAIAQLIQDGKRYTARDLFYHLAIEDIQAAADALLPVYSQSGGRDGMVSIEVSPALAYDTAGTIKEARYLHQRVNRPNAMIKVPATAAGLPAIETLIADGISINVTLLFSVNRYREVVEAYLHGLELRAKQGKDISNIASVASFFISRVDNTVDKMLQDLARTAPAAQQAQLKTMQGKTAIANAKRAYALYKDVFFTPRFEKLRAAGAQAQRLLWASTGTKNPEFSDVLYVDSLIGPDTVNTVPPATYKAFKEHGHAAPTLEQGLADAELHLAALDALHIDMKQVTEQLEKDGVKLFADSFNDLLNAIETKLKSLTPKVSAAG
ncbi:MAG: transaldolase [Gammaproteobacteria bacterium]|nr:transaldolase [Gammaproteobacteria bacterium]